MSIAEWSEAPKESFPKKSFPKKFPIDIKPIVMKSASSYVRVQLTSSIELVSIVIKRYVLRYSMPVTYGDFMWFALSWKTQIYDGIVSIFRFESCWLSIEHRIANRKPCSEGICVATVTVSLQSWNDNDRRGWICSINWLFYQPDGFTDSGQFLQYVTHT